MIPFTTTKDSPNHRTYYLRVPVRSFFWESVRGESTYGRTPLPQPTVALEIGAIKGIQTFYIHEGYEVKIQKARFVFVGRNRKPNFNRNRQAQRFCRMADI
jgi:hypothetical protein